MIEEDEQKFGNIDNDNNYWLTIKVESQNTAWVLRRSYDNARILDHQLHKCVYNRKFSLLPELQPVPSHCENPNVSSIVIIYFVKIYNFSKMSILYFYILEICKRID